MCIGRIVENRGAISLQVERTHFPGLGSAKLKFINVQRTA